MTQPNSVELDPVRLAVPQPVAGLPDAGWPPGGRPPARRARPEQRQPDHVPAGRHAPRPDAGWALAADGSYAARLAGTEGPGQGLYVERWALGGSDAYPVRLPVDRPESPDCAVLAMSDGRVLIARPDDGCHRLFLLYPTGPGTGELPLGSLESERLTLLPPGPDGRSAHLLVPGFHSTAVWLVCCDGSAEPLRLVADVPGHCLDGHWLDRSGRLLALNRREACGRSTAVVVDLARGGEVTPLLEIGERSDDRLLLADPDSGLLLVRSDAPGEPRTGWGVLGSHRPVRFPEALHQAELALNPFAVQPGQELMPESAAVALRADGPNGTWVALWRPGQRKLRHLPAPQGWLCGAGALDAEGALLLPYAHARASGVVRVARAEPEAVPRSGTGRAHHGKTTTRPARAVPVDDRRNVTPGPGARLGEAAPGSGEAVGDGEEGRPAPSARERAAQESDAGREAGAAQRSGPRSAPVSASTVRGTGRVRAIKPPVPLQQAPLTAAAPPLGGR